MAVNKLDIAARTAFEARRAFILPRLYYLMLTSEGQKRRESPSFAAINISTHQGLSGLVQDVSQMQHYRRCSRQKLQSETGKRAE